MRTDVGIHVEKKKGIRTYVDIVAQAELNLIPSV
jgi:hypothetical protein